MITPRIPKVGLQLCYPEAESAKVVFSLLQNIGCIRRRLNKGT